MSVVVGAALDDVESVIENDVNPGDVAVVCVFSTIVEDVVFKCATVDDEVSVGAKVEEVFSDSELVIVGVTEYNGVVVTDVDDVLVCTSFGDVVSLPVADAKLVFTAVDKVVPLIVLDGVLIGATLDEEVTVSELDDVSASEDADLSVSEVVFILVGAAVDEVVLDSE